MKQVFYATVEDDLSLRFLNVAKWKTHLLRFKGKTVEVTAENRRKSRSGEQNAYYWAVVVKMIADHCGYRTQEEVQGVHEELRRKFLTGHGPLGVTPSTAILSTEEFSEYLEAVRRWAADELSIYIPEPGEVEA